MSVRYMVVCFVFACLCGYASPTRAQDFARLREVSEAGERWAVQGLWGRAEDAFRNALSLCVPGVPSEVERRLRVRLAWVLERSAQRRSRRLMEALHYAFRERAACAQTTREHAELLSRMYSRLDLSMDAEFWAACARRHGGQRAAPEGGSHPATVWERIP